MKKFLSIIILFHLTLTSDIIYKEIKIYNDEIQNFSIIQSLGIDVDHISQNEHYIQFAISEYDLNKLIVNNISYEIIHEDLQLYYESRLDQNYTNRDFELGSMGGYYTFDEIESQLDQLSSMYPSIVSEKISIGETYEGRDIWAIKISDNYQIEEDEPEILYTGLHHAREPMSYMNLFYFMHWLGENYENNSLAQHIVNNRQLWFVPAINPDGLIYNQSIAPNGGGMQRKNTRETCSGTPDGIDLNRNYSYFWGYDNEGSSPDGCNETYRGNSPFSEPETQVIRDFVNSHNFKINFNYHSYSNLLIYPFGYEYENDAPQEDIDIYIEYGQDMVQYNNYALGTGPDLLYTVNGEACDWMYGEKNIFSYTPEIGGNSDGFWPSTNRIIPLAEENLYPNQVLAINGGSKYEVEIDVLNSDFTINENYPLYISVFNSGLSNSNGEVVIEIESSENLNFELDEIILDELDSRELIDLGDITYFQLDDNGTVEEIVVNVYDGDQFVYSNSLQIVTGITNTFISSNFEDNQGWTVGSSSDSATAGLWERVEPNPTYDENNEIVQPGEDHSNNGSYCFITQNSTNQNNPGQTDVDGGKTTLLSPVFNLSDYDEALFSYWKWYSNNQGNNPGTDYWMVDVSNDGGNTWITIENSTESNNYWLFKQFLITEFIDLTDQVQFRFIAEDIFHEGDAGSGGSLVEAGLDDFLIEVFEENNSSCTLGDLNEDLAINVVDIVTMVSLIITLDNEQLNDYLCSGDLNGDLLINVQDIIILVGIILS